MRPLGLALAVAALLLAAPDAGAERFRRSAERRYHRDRATDVRHLFLDIELDVEKGTVAGTSTLRLVLLRDADSIVLDAAGLRIDGVQVDGKPAGHEVQAEQQAIRIALHGASPAGTEHSVEVRYAAAPRRGMYFLRRDDAYPDQGFQVFTQGEAEDNRYWYPGYDYPDDRFTTEVKATVGAPLTVVGNGTLVATADAGGGRRTFHWLQSVEHVNYLVSLVAGELDRHEIPGHRVPMAAWLSRRDGPHAARTFGRTPSMMTWMESLTGVPYPFSRYDQVVVEDFLWGGMENTTATSLGESAVVDERAFLDGNSDSLILHELSHQWFGNLVTCRSWAHLWLNEGLATYLEMLWVEDTKGPDEALAERIRESGWYLHEGYSRPLVEYEYAHPDDLFDGHTYVKGAWILHMLRVRLGDNAFRKAIGRYARTFGGVPVETSDLRRAFEEASGRELQGFFDEWVHRGGHPELDVSDSWSERDHRLTLAVEQRGDGRFRFLAPVVAVGEFGRKDGIVEIGPGRAQLVAFTVPSRPWFVEVDPWWSVLSEVDHEQSALALSRQVRAGTTVRTRQDAAEKLGRVTGDASRELAVQSLAGVLSDTDAFYQVREHAAESLGSLGGERSRAVLLQAIGDKDGRIRRAVCEALGTFADGDVRRALAQAVAADPSQAVVAAAVEAYAGAGADEESRTAALEMARKALERPSHMERIAQAAIRALGQLGGEAAFRLVLDATAWGRPTDVRRQAARTLATMAAGESQKRRARRRLQELLLDPRLWVQDAAVGALESLGDKRAVPALERYLLAGARSRRLERGVLDALDALKPRPKKPGPAQ